MNQSDVIALAQKYAPLKTEHELIRLGPFFDGGYLVPDDLSGITACYSPGVADIAQFESDLLRIWGIPSHLADKSVNGPPHGFPAASFVKKFLGNQDNDEFMTMETWMKSTGQVDGDFLLQMDIEGGEYDTLLATPDELLSKFRIIVLEIHFLDKWNQPENYKQADDLITKLGRNHVVVHSHPNNWGRTAEVEGVTYPCTIEVTFLRKDRCTIGGPVTDFPHRLDMPCGPQIPDFALPQVFRATV
jgi:hypothetical protein